MLVVSPRRGSRRWSCAISIRDAPDPPSSPPASAFVRKHRLKWRHAKKPADQETGVGPGFDRSGGRGLNVNPSEADEVFPEHEDVWT